MWVKICSVLINFRLKISLTTQSIASTQSAPRNGLNFVISRKVGINHNPPIPKNSITSRCHTLSRVSSPRNGIAIQPASTLSGNIRLSIHVGITQANKQGIARIEEKLVAVKAPLVQRTRPSGLPMTVSAPPQFAARRIADPKIIRCLRLCTILCIITSIITVVVRLSRLAEITNVTIARVQIILRLLRVFINWVMKSKQPLLLSISTIVIVASKNNTISAACPT